MTGVSTAVRRRLDEAEFEAGRLWQARVVKAIVAETIAAGEPTANAILERLYTMNRAIPYPTHRDVAVAVLKDIAVVAPDIANRVADQFGLNLSEEHDSLRGR